MADRGKHIQGAFDAALNALKNDALMMSSLTERLFDSAMEGLLTRNSDLSNQSVADDEEIDVLEKQIDRVGVDLLIRFHPVASDMRQVISTMKLSTNLERVADQAVSIARRARKLNVEPAIPEVALLEPLFREAKSMLRDSLHAFVEGDADLARKLKPRDRYLDQLNTALSEELTIRMAAKPEAIPSYLSLIFVARALERIGDHATNIAEDTIWVEQAEDIRHTYGTKPAVG
ncbi:MAG: phosphate signaling complex protein PhoU [Verrucomicrobia bacterium]|nr:phosphate signaling complex protein PhoU [Verrucomicrobiota bacterium]